MARHTKADAARHLGISRTTLYKLIEQGMLSPTADGWIDDTELVRAAPFVDTLKERPRTTMDPVPVDTPVHGGVHHGRPREGIREQAWTSMDNRQVDTNISYGEHSGRPREAVHERPDASVYGQAWTSTDALVDTLREQLALAQEREKEQERRHEAREREYLNLIAWLRLQIEETHQRYERQLAAPPPPAPVAPVSTRAASPAADRGDMRQRILALLRDAPDGLSPAQTRQRLGVEKDLGSTMKAMRRDGLLRRVVLGQYTAAD